MRIGKTFLVIAYVMTYLLSGTHSAGVSNIEQAIVSVQDFFASLKEDKQKSHDDDVCLFVAYVLNGGVNHENNKTVIYQKDLPRKLGVPTRKGYNFAGWYTDSNFTNKVTELSAVYNSDIVLFAKWTQKIDNYYNVEMYAYENPKERVLSKQKTLTECNYRFLDDMVIPGMPQTREQDYMNSYITEAAQCMQGLCFTPEYILLTSYADSETVPGTLMVFDRTSGNYMFSLSMKPNSHLGGVAYDGENIWICHSEQNTLERISYEFVKMIAESGANECVDASGISDEYAIENSPSCITCYGGRLWVATHTTVFSGRMVSYMYDENTDTLNAITEYAVPKEVQGIAFDADGSIYFSTSYGRKNSSYLKGYTSLLELSENLKEPSVTVEMPPCSEEIAFVDDSLFILFESASEKYFEGTDGKGVSIAPLDTLLEIELVSIW